MASCAAEAPPHRRWSTSQQETTPPSRHPLHNRPIRSFVVRHVKCCTCPPVSPVHLSHLDSWAVRCSLASGPRRQDTCCQGVWCFWRGRGQSRSDGGFWWGCWSRADQRCRSPNTETSRTSRTSPRGLRDRRTVRHGRTRTDGSTDGRSTWTGGGRTRLRLLWRTGAGGSTLGGVGAQPASPPDSAPSTAHGAGGPRLPRAPALRYTHTHTYDQHLNIRDQDQDQDQLKVFPVF